MVAVVIVPVLWPALLQAIGWIICLSAMQFGGTGVSASTSSTAGKLNCQASNNVGTACPSVLDEIDSDVFTDPLTIFENKAACSDVGESYFRPNEVYAYNYVYTASLPSRRGSTSQHETNEMAVECDVRIESSVSCRHVMQVRNCTISEQWQRDRLTKAEIKPKSDYFSKEIASFPLVFVIRNGTAKELWSNNHESAAILNFKRGILSTLVTRKLQSVDGQQFELREDVQGTCPTKYSLDDKGRTVLAKDYSNCQSFESSGTERNNALITLWNKSFVDFFGISSTSQCSFEFRKTGELFETICTETHSRIAVSQQFQVSTRQALTLSAVTPLRIPTGYDVRNFRKVETHYQHQHAPSSAKDKTISSHSPDLLDTILSVGSRFLGEFQDGVKPSTSAQSAIAGLLPLMATFGGIDANLLLTVAELGMDEKALQNIVAASSALPLSVWNDLLSIASMLSPPMSEDEPTDRMHNWLPENQKKADTSVLQLLGATQEVVTLAGIPLIWSAKAFVTGSTETNFTDTVDSVGNQGYKKDLNISGEINFENRMEVVIPGVSNIGTETVTSWSTSAGGFLESVGSGNGENLNFRFQLPVRELQILALREKEYSISNFVTEQLAPHSGGLFSGAEGELWCSYALVPIFGKRICVTGSDPSATFADFLPFISDSSTASWEFTLQHLLPDPVVFRMQFSKNDSNDVGNITSLFLHILGANAQDGVVHLSRTKSVRAEKIDLAVDLPLVTRFNVSASKLKEDGGISLHLSSGSGPTYAVEYSTGPASSMDGQSNTLEGDAVFHNINLATSLGSFAAAGYRHNNKTVVHLHNYPMSVTGCDIPFSARVPDYSVTLKLDTNSNDLASSVISKMVNDVVEYPVNAQVVVNYPVQSDENRSNQNITLTGSFDVGTDVSSKSFQSKFLLEGSNFKHSVTSSSAYFRSQDGFRLKHNFTVTDRTNSNTPLATYDLQVDRESPSAPLHLKHTLSSEFYQFYSALVSETVSGQLELDMNLTTRSPFWDTLNSNLRQLVSGGQETMNLTSSLVDIEVAADWRNGYEKSFTFKSKDVDIIPNMVWSLNFEGIHKGEIVIRMVDSSINIFIIHQLTNINPLTFTVTVCVQERCSHPQIDLLSFLVGWTLTFGEPDCMSVNTTVNQKLVNEANHIYETTFNKFSVMVNYMIDDLDHPLNKMADRFFGFTFRDQFPVIKSLFVNHVSKNVVTAANGVRAAFDFALQFLRSPPVGATCSDLSRWAQQISQFTS